MGAYTQSVVPAGKVTTMLTDKLAEGIDDSKFACKPEGVDCNSPAWIFGHLALYPDRITEALGRKELVKPLPEGWDELFGFKSECKDDPKCSVYPPKEKLISEFKTRHETMLGALAEADEATLAKENPNENMRDMFPTIGAMGAFMATSHAMMHLGQLSTWRRCMGLGPAM